MSQAVFQELRAKSALNRSGRRGGSWSLNPYRGCAHACVYCYARAYHSYLDVDWHESFERVIFAKPNLPDLLRRELTRPAARQAPICIGPAADPYQPAEGTYRITRRCLEVIADAGNRCTILTKGTLVVRDLDVLVRMANRATVLFSITTLNEALAGQLEPDAPPSRSRLRAMERLSAGGVRVGVLVCPVLPGITDSPGNLEAVIQACADCGAVELWVGPLRLSALVRAHFLPVLDRHYPHLSAAYRRLYAYGADPARAYREQLERRAEELRLACGIPNHPVEEPALAEPEQLALPLVDVGV